MGLRELRARFANRTEKKNKVWQAVADTFNEEMRRRYPQYDVRSVLHLRHKWDNQIRAARRHNLFVLKNNGTHGGSGNGRDVLEDVKPPPYYEDLLEAGWLQGPLSNPVNIMNGGSKTADLVYGASLEGAELAEEAASWAADELPDTQEPYGGSSESRKLADKRKKSVESNGSKGPGRPTKLGQLLSAADEQAAVLADASLEGGKRLADAITAAVKVQVEEARVVAQMQMEEARAVRKEQAKLRKRQWKEEREESRRHRAAMVECMGMLAKALMGFNQSASGSNSL
jgi:hypothetical protein